MAIKRGPGRPPTPPAKAKRYPLNLRTTKERRRQLERAAYKSGRSLVQEVEHRLDQSFSAEFAIPSGFDGPVEHQTFKTAAAAAQTVSTKLGASWLSDPDTYRKAEAVMFAIFRALSPLPTDEKAKPWPTGLITVFEKEGREAYAETLERVAKDVRGIRTEEEEEQELRAAGKKMLEAR